MPALVLGSGITAASDPAVYLAPTSQLCYDADNFFPWSFCHDRYLIGNSVSDGDFRVSAGAGDDIEPHATGEWAGGRFDLQVD